MENEKKKMLILIYKLCIFGIKMNILSYNFLKIELTIYWEIIQRLYAKMDMIFFFMTSNSYL